MPNASTRRAPRATTKRTARKSPRATQTANSANRSANLTASANGSIGAYALHSYRLPWPPSLNRLWRATPGGVKLSEAGRQYAIAVSNALPVGVVRKFRNRLVVWAILHAPDARSYGVDNR